MNKNNIFDAEDLEDMEELDALEIELKKPTWYMYPARGLSVLKPLRKASIEEKAKLFDAFIDGLEYGESGTMPDLDKFTYQEQVMFGLVKEAVDESTARMRQKQLTGKKNYEKGRRKRGSVT